MSYQPQIVLFHQNYLRISHTRKLTVIALTTIVATLDILWILAEEISIYLYLNTPCPAPCDKVYGWSQLPFGAMLIIAAAVVYVSGRII